MMPRSWLFVPGDDERKLARVATSDADAVIVDLEDAVGPTRKIAARDLTMALLADGAARHERTWVRINPAGTPWHEADLAAFVAAKPVGIVVPKVTGPDVLHALDGALTAAGSDSALLPLVTETAQGVASLPTYAALPARVTALTWGAEDLAADIGALANRAADGAWLAPFELARSLCLIAAGACDIAAIDTVYTDFRDLDGLAAYARGARQLGFVGMMAIHPAQVAVIHEAFRPTPAEVDGAKAVLAALAAAGDGVAAIDGRMLDEPHRRQAERILALAAAGR